MKLRINSLLLVFFYSDLHPDLVRKMEEPHRLIEAEINSYLEREEKKPNFQSQNK